MSLEEASIVPLKDVVKRVKVGFVGSCNDDYCSPEVGVPMIRTTNLTKEGIKLENLKYINNKFHVSHIKSQLNFGDILIARHGHNGLASLWEYKFDAQCLNVVVVEPNESLADKYYLTYLINSPLIQQQIKSLTGGSVQSVVNTKDIADLLIPVPPLSKQKEIANFISLFNKKIAINKSINKNLDILLMSIFRSWFINFEDYDSLNGMKTDDSFGNIPKLWSVVMLQDYVDFVTGVEPGSKNYHEKPEDNDIPFLRVGDLRLKNNVVFINQSLSKNKILKFDDIVLSLDATIGIVKMGLEGSYSSGMRKLVIKKENINKPFLYCLVKTERIQRIIETFATGTTILHAGKSIKHMDFILPDKQTMDNFGKIGDSILTIILSNLKEIEKLQKLRDTLLPKLMSGEIDVSEVNCDLKIIIRKIYIKSSKLFLWRYLSENKNYIKNTKSNETLLKSRTIYKINKFLAKFNARYRYYRQ